MPSGIPSHGSSSSDPAPVGPVKPIVYLIALSAATAGLLFGLDIGVISGAQRFIKAEWSLSDKMVEDIVSYLLWGATAGALACGWISARLGRKRTLLLAALIFIFGSLGCAAATSPTNLLAMRFFLGLAVGIASFVAPLYLSEIAPPRVRGSMVAMYQLMITIGIVLAFLSDTYFATSTAITTGQWRWMLSVLSVPAALMFAAVLTLPESPRWLVMAGRPEQARQVLVRVRGGLDEVQAELAGIEGDLEVPQKGWALFRENANFRRAVYLGFALQAIQQLTGINVVMYYAPKIFQLAGYASVKEQMLCTVLVGLTNVFSTFLAIFFVDRWGRKPMMYAGFLVMGTSMLTVGVLFHSGAIHQAPWLAVAALLIFIAGFATSAGPIIWILCSEIFPLAGRDFGVTVSTGTNWIVNGIVGATFLQLLTGLGPGNTFLMYGSLEVVFFLFFLRFVPETKGVTLEQIANNLLAGEALKNLGSTVRKKGVALSSPVA